MNLTKFLNDTTAMLCKLAVGNMQQPVIDILEERQPRITLPPDEGNGAGPIPEVHGALGLAGEHDVVLNAIEEHITGENPSEQ